MHSSTSPHLPTPSLKSRANVRWRQIVWFVVLTYGLTWLVVSPLYLIDDPGLFRTLYLPVSLVMMSVPALIAWLIVRKKLPKGQRASALGFTRHRPVPRFLGYLALAFIIPIGIGLLSLPIASAFGLYETDFENFSGMQQLISEAGVTGVSVEVLLIGQIINIVLASWFINLLPALGEEIGWRGWLTPQLLPLGVLPTILITGVIWGLWHTPLILLGHNYPHLPGWLAVIFMVAFCTIVGGVLAWLSIRTNSVWPAALGHSTINATAAMPMLFSTEPSFDTAHVGIAGTTGWIVTAVLVVIFFLTKSFRPAPAAPLDPSSAWPTDYPSARLDHTDGSQPQLPSPQDSTTPKQNPPVS